MATKTAHGVNKETVYWSAKFHCLKDGATKRTIPGLLDVLKSHFYPKYKYELATYGPATSSPLARSRRRVKGSRRVGTAFDNAVERSILLLRTYQFRPEVFWEKKVFDLAIRQRGLKSTHKLWLQQLYRGNIRKPYVKNFWEIMRTLKMRPCSAQVTVKHRDLPLATRVDLVCQDVQKRYHVIELKTGFESYYYKHTKH